MDYDYLSEICQLKQWKTIPNKELIREGFPVYGANGIVGYYSKYNHVSETILLGCRGTCGSVHISKPYSYINGNALCLDNLSNCYNMYYVYYFLKSLDYSKIISGTGIPQITQICLKNVTIPRFPLEKQIKISNELINIDELIKKNKLLLVKLDNIVKSQFIEMFGNPIDNNKMWPSDKAVNLCQIVTDGSHFSPVADENGNIPMLSVKDMRINTFCYDNCKMIGEDIYQIMLGQGCVPQIGDVLVAKDGSYFTRAFAIKEFRKQAILSSIGMYRPNQVKILPRFLADYLMSDKVIDFVNNGYVTGSALKRVIIKGLKEIPIYIPPVNLQSKYILFVEQIDKSKYFEGGIP